MPCHSHRPSGFGAHLIPKFPGTTRWGNFHDQKNRLNTSRWPKKLPGGRRGLRCGRHVLAWSLPVTARIDGSILTVALRPHGDDRPAGAATEDRIAHPGSHRGSIESNEPFFQQGGDVAQSGVLADAGVIDHDRWCPAFCRRLPDGRVYLGLATYKLSPRHDEISHAVRGQRGPAGARFFRSWRHDLFRAAPCTMT